MRWIPKRQCLSCRTKKEKRELIRVARMADGSLALADQEGRGAYLCREGDCVARALKKNQISRALKAEVGEALRTALEEAVK